MAAQDNAPWVLIKGGPEDRRKCGALLNACAGLCLLLAALVEPFMPSVTRKVKRALGLAFISCLPCLGHLCPPWLPAPSFDFTRSAPACSMSQNGRLEVPLTGILRLELSAGVRAAEPGT